MKRILCLILLTCLLASPVLHAYPPENAAVLYYKHMEHFASLDDAIWDELRNFKTSDKPASDEMKKYLNEQKQKHLIEELQVASELKQCDWGLDFSKGFDLLMPGLSSMKNFHYLMLAESAMQASEGNITEALEKNLATRRMGQHISNDMLVGFLVSLAINRSSDQALAHLLGTYPIDEKTLIDFKNELLWKTYQPKSIRHPLMMEKEVCLVEFSMMTPQRYKKLTGDWDSNSEKDKEMDQRVLQALANKGPSLLEESSIYLEKYYNNIFAIIEKPYPQVHSEIEAAAEKAEKDSENEKEEAYLTAIFCPALAKCYNLGIGWKTNYNATLTALDVYIIAAKTGKLPDKLPASTYIDHFSGKPFIYEITEDGFVLKCQQEDLVKKETHEFSFKLPQ